MSKLSMVRGLLKAKNTHDYPSFWQCTLGLFLKGQNRYRCDKELKCIDCEYLRDWREVFLYE